MNALSLFELQTFLRQVVALNFPEALWVRCEIAQANTARGHLYLELVEKAEQNHEVAAQASAVLWQSTLRRLSAQRSGTELGQLLQTGAEVLLKVKVDFHERYGLKLVVEDVDPSYTLGQLEFRRRQYYTQLAEGGYLNKNAQVPLRPVLQRIAVISAETAAGFQDFQQHLRENSYGYTFSTTFFAAAMQGNQVETEVLKRLRQISRQALRFDAVVLIRGGGGKLDLAGFDSLALCQAIAEFPLPVLTGIGHDIDETLVDLVAHTALKTPTAVADFLIQHNLQFEIVLAQQRQLLRFLATEYLHTAKLQLSAAQQVLQHQPGHLLGRHREQLLRWRSELPLLARYPQREQSLILEQLEQCCQLLSIESTLQRGFALVSSKGQPLSSSTLPDGTPLEIQFRDGIVEGEVKRPPSAPRSAHS